VSVITKSNARLRRIDAVVRAGAALRGAIGDLERCELRALADRLDLACGADKTDDQLRRSIQRRLIGVRL
jgi:hypothetical protein